MSPNYVSKDGVFYPAKEYAVLPHLAGTGKEIYKGPDRAALFELFKAGVETFGIDFHKDPQIIERVKQLGYKDVDEYAEAHGYDKEKSEAAFKLKAEVVSKHELPKKIEEVKKLGGGTDTSGQGQDTYGGFGQPKDIPVTLR